MLRWLLNGLLALLMLGALVAGYVFYPYWTLTRIDAAMRDGDIATLETLIDWDRVRSGVRADMNTMLMEKARGDANNSGFVALGTALGGAVVDRMVDGAVSPNGLINAVKNAQPDPMGKIVARVWFTSPTTFIVALRQREELGGGELPAQVLMQLSGATWRVTRLLIDIPGLDALSTAGGVSAAPTMRAIEGSKTKP